MEGKLSIGNVLSGAFSTIGSNPLATLGPAFLLGSLPALLFSYFLSIPMESDAVLGLFDKPGGIAIYVGFLALSVLCSMLLQAMLVRVTVAHVHDEKISIGATLAPALAKILPLLGLTILMTLGLGAATLLLIVPGIILYVMWLVATPALVAEDIGITEALGRSRALTKGHRWKIVGLLLVVGILISILSGLVSVILVAAGQGAGTADGAAGNGLPIGYLVVTAIVNTLTTAVSATLVARLYLELRTVKEGPMTDALADVFA